MSLIFPHWFISGYLVEEAVNISLSGLERHGGDRDSVVLSPGLLFSTIKAAYSRLVSSIF
jgi:hypothetical protein